MQRRARNRIQGLGSLTCEESVRDLSVFVQPSGETVEGTPHHTSHCLKGSQRGGGDSLSAQSHMEKTRGTGPKALLGRL